MEKVKKFFSTLPERLKNYFKEYFSHLHYFWWILFIAIAIGLFCLDYFSKIWAYNHLAPLGSGYSEVFIPGLLDFTLVGNTGAAFGAMSGWQFVLVPISIIASFFLTINLLFRFERYNWGVRVAITLMLPGAVGNLVDRIGYWAQNVERFKNGVVDFLQFDFWKSFPVCNVADYCLTVGIVVLLISFIFQFKEEYRRLEKEEAEEKKREQEAINNGEQEQMNEKLAHLEASMQETKEEQSSSEQK